MVVYYLKRIYFDGLDELIEMGNIFIESNFMYFSVPISSLISSQVTLQYIGQYL